jgi:hypothetical protein
MSAAGPARGQEGSVAAFHLPMISLGGRQVTLLRHFRLLMRETGSSLVARPANTAE